MAKLPVQFRSQCGPGMQLFRSLRFWGPVMQPGPGRQKLSPGLGLLRIILLWTQTVMVSVSASRTPVWLHEERSVWCSECASVVGELVWSAMAAIIFNLIVINKSGGLIFYKVCHLSPATHVGRESLFAFCELGFFWRVVKQLVMISLCQSQEMLTIGSGEQQMCSLTVF
jgi:hypothetical protein